MPIITVPNSDLSYYLLCYDKNGNERKDDPDSISGGLLSNNIIESLTNTRYTDVFFSSHGWKGDIPAAIEQYNDWLSAMLICKADIARLKSRPQGFKPLIIGLHWPSLPFGVETHTPSLRESEENSLFVDYSHSKNNDTTLYEQVADAISDTDHAQKAIQTIIDYAADDLSPESLSPEVVTAFEILITESGLKTGSEASPPDEDIPAFDVKAIYALLQEELADEDLLDFGESGYRGPLIGLLTQTSVWKMKQRARVFGEKGAAQLLRELLYLTSTKTAFHLMGHSFGTIAVSSAITGTAANEPLPRPVNSLFLVQGALSLWAYCNDIPVKRGTSGYYQNISSPSVISGAILASYTENDTAVKKLFPLAAKATFWKGIDFDPNALPKYGGLGAFGVRGDGINIKDINLLPLSESYHFQPNVFYNLYTSEYMKPAKGLSGAHNDIAHPEMAHAFWSCIR